MPVWLILIMMTLTAYRATRLATKDDFPLILWMRDRLAGGWRPMTGAEQEMYRMPLIDGDVQILPFPVTDIDGVTNRWVQRASWSPHWLAELITCPWCASAYLSGALTFAVDWTVGLPVPWLVGPAVWAGAALLGSREWA